jgi:hypothetical protein
MQNLAVLRLVLYHSKLTPTPLGLNWPGIAVLFNHARLAQKNLLQIKKNAN